MDLMTELAREQGSKISPLGVSRRATPKPPAFWRLTTLAIGIAVFAFGLSATTHNGIGAEAYPGLIITMIGLVIAGPWLTAQAARLLGRLSRGSSGLLATRRLADNPRVAFRSVSGLVLAVFLGTMVETLAPALNAIQATPGSAALSNILVAQGNGTPEAGQQLIQGVDAVPGATAYPLYQLRQPAQGAAGNGNGKAADPGGAVVAGARGAKAAPGFGPFVAVSCPTMRAIAALGECAPGVTAVRAGDGDLQSDNPIDQTKPFVSATSPAYAGELTQLPLQLVLVRVNSAATLERVRTYLAVHTPPQTGGGSGSSSPTPPRTFGETLAIRSTRAVLFEKIMDAAVALTLVVAGCSLAVAVGGGLVDRKRPFTLLRVSGTQVGVLTRVVLFEAAVPLAVATVVAAGIAYGASVLAFVRLAPAHSAIPLLGHDYYAIMGVGLAAAFAVIGVTLPLLRRMTAPGNVRFE